jgi:ketosteroid isomerase-like protein
MSPTPLELTKRAYELTLRGSFDEWLTMLADDVCIVLPPSIPHGGTYRGHEGARLLRSRLLASWSEFDADILDYLVGQDSVIAIIKLRAVARATGRKVEARIAEYWRFRAGQVVELSAYYFDTKAVFDSCN